MGDVVRMTGLRKRARVQLTQDQADSNLRAGGKKQRGMKCWMTCWSEGEAVGCGEGGSVVKVTDVAG